MEPGSFIPKPINILDHIEAVSMFRVKAGFRASWLGTNPARKALSSFPIFKAAFRLFFLINSKKRRVNRADIFCPLSLLCNAFHYYLYHLRNAKFCILHMPF